MAIVGQNLYKFDLSNIPEILKVYKNTEDNDNFSKSVKEL